MVFAVLKEASRRGAKLEMPEGPDDSRQHRRLPKWPKRGGVGGVRWQWPRGVAGQVKPTVSGTPAVFREL